MGDVASETEVLQAARAAVENAERVVIVTGAGVSAESGIPTFRDPEDGLWARFKPEELATPQAFSRDPCRVWEWYDLRRRAVLACQPNPGHLAIARFLLEKPSAILVTQNVDGLHDLAVEIQADAMGMRPDEAFDRVLALHGSLLHVRCSECTYDRPDRSPVDAGASETLPSCPDCGALLRPAVVWFGEMLDWETLERAFEAARASPVCVVAGTSALVHPAASLPAATLAAGGDLVEINPRNTPLSGRARWRLAGSAGQLLPKLLV